MLAKYAFDIFTIEILDLQSQEPLYRVSLNLPYIAKPLYGIILQNLRITGLYDKLIKIESLWEKVLTIKQKCKSLLKGLGIKGFSEDTLDGMASYFAYKILGLQKVFPFLLDERVNEFYLDKPMTRIYLDHSEFGRCISNITLTTKDVQRFITHIEIESKLPLNYMNPSLKWNLSIKGQTLRVSIDIPPLSHEGPSLDIRRIRYELFTIIDLVKSGVLSKEEAAFLLLHVINRRNIVICGEPGSGKTTLMNALDLCTPRYWRKIYVEDVVESLEQRSKGRHQLRLYVEPYETSKKFRRKYHEIIKLLHRTPDWICLGELQTREHFKALFHALTAGLRGIQTCHASSAEGLVKRWLLHCKIPKEDIMEVDLIIHMVKCYRGSKAYRRVSEVLAVGEVNEGECRKIMGVPLTTIFKWNPMTDEHEKMLHDIFQSPSIRKMMTIGINVDILRDEFNLLLSFINTALTKKFSSIDEFLTIYDGFITKALKGDLYVL